MADAANDQGNVAELREEIKELRGEAKTWRLKLRASEEEHEKVVKDRDAYKAKVEGFESEKAKAVEEATKKVAGERDALKAQLATTPDEWKAKYEELAGANRTRDHKDAFRKAAEAADLNPDAIEDAWELATSRHGYKAESDAPDEAKIKGAVGEVLKGRAYLLKPKADPSAKAADAANGAPGGRTAPTIPAKGPATGSGRGTSESGRPLTTVVDKVEAQWQATGRADVGRI